MEVLVIIAIVVWVVGACLIGLPERGGYFPDVFTPLVHLVWALGVWAVFSAIWLLVVYQYGVE